MLRFFFVIDRRLDLEFI